MNVTSMQLTQLWIKEEAENTYFPYIHNCITSLCMIISVIGNMYRFYAINWGVTLGQIRKKPQKRIRIHLN